jgi:hypothetical protein
MPGQCDWKTVDALQDTLDYLGSDQAKEAICLDPIFLLGSVPARKPTNCGDG